jgi:hypothetical protein
MSFDLPHLEGPALRVESAEADGVITTRLIGTAESECKDDLDRYVRVLHDSVLRLGIAKVVVDFRELAFMNSSSLKVFVTWMALARDVPDDKSYRIHFVPNASMHWQRRSLAALKNFAVNLVSVDA